MPPPLPYFKVNIYPFPLLHNIFRLFVILSLTQLYRYTPEIFLFRLPRLNISTGPPSDKLDKNSQRMWLIKIFVNGLSSKNISLLDLKNTLQYSIIGNSLYLHFFVFYLLTRKPNLEIFSIYSNFTCPNFFFLVPGFRQVG